MGTLAKPEKPVKYSQRITDEICEKLSGGQSLRSICTEPGFPKITSVFRWLDRYPEFSIQYARARQAQGESFVDELIDIADDPTGDPQRLKLRIDARKWAASKFHGSRYGDKVAVNHGGQADNPVEVVTKITLSAAKPDED